MLKRLILACLFIIAGAFPVYAAESRITYNDNQNGSYEDEAEFLEMGNKILFNTKDELSDFLAYYFDEYRLNDYMAMYHHEVTDDEISVYITELSPYDRDEYIKYVIDNFGYASGNTVEEKIKDTCNKLKKMTYNSDYADTDLKECIDARQGVCWQFAKIAAIILQESGVNTRAVSGYTKGYHMWLITDVGNNIIYTDPVVYACGDYSAWNIPIERYTAKYREESGIKI